jgi:hypothetical protein
LGRKLKFGDSFRVISEAGSSQPYLSSRIACVAAALDALLGAKSCMFLTAPDLTLCDRGLGARQVQPAMLASDHLLSGF